MLKKAAFAAFLFAGSLLVGAMGAAHAEEIVHNPYLPLCSLTYHSDSFGRGVEAAVLGGDRRPQLVDEQCYGLGIDWVSRNLGSPARVSERCLADFNSGRAQGLEAEAGTDGTACASLGYTAGRADLDVGAREGDEATVGESCVKVYRQGVADFQDHLAATVPDTFGSALKTAACYNMGYFDGGL